MKPIVNPTYKSSAELDTNPDHDPNIDQSKTTSSEKEEESKNTKPLSERLLNYVKAVLLVSLLLVIGGLIGIGLGLVVFIFVCKKPIIKTIKKALAYLNKKREKRKRTREIDPAETREEKKTREIDPETETSSLEMNKEDLKKMKTRPDSVSVKVLPKEQSTSTSNGLKSKSTSKFQGSKFEGFTKPTIGLSGEARKRRNSLPSRKNSLPNRTTRRATIK